MPRKQGRQGAGLGPCTPATADAPIPTSPPRSCVAVETPATPATPEPKRAKTHEVVVAEVRMEFWRKEAMKKEDERFLLEWEVGELKEALRSSEGEGVKLRAELREVKAKADRAVIEARNVERYHVEKIGDLEKTVERNKEGEIEAARRKVTCLPGFWSW